MGERLANRLFGRACRLPRALAAASCVSLIVNDPSLSREPETVPVDTIEAFQQTGYCGRGVALHLAFYRALYTDGALVADGCSPPVTGATIAQAGLTAYSPSDVPTHSLARPLSGF
jgi:hypothetical protein